MEWLVRENKQQANEKKNPDDDYGWSHNSQENKIDEP